VARGAVRVRAAVEADLPAMVDLGEELRDQLLPLPESGKRSRTGARPANGAAATAARAQLAARYGEALADPQRHLVLAVDAHDVPLGMALLTVTAANALLDIPAVHMSHAVVPDRNRRRGAGKALVAACLAYADEQGIDQLVVSVHPGSRDANRFFARLGFAPLAVRRVAPVGVVRRQLAATSEPGAVDSAVRHVRRPVRRPSRRVVVRAEQGADGRDGQVQL
jgi:GNAT superfamily N-acetyltransferase